MRTKTTTTTREYDTEGKLVKETVSEHEYEHTGPFSTPSCICSVNYYGYCPVHGYRYGFVSTSPTITVTSGTAGITSTIPRTVTAR